MYTPKPILFISIFLFISLFLLTCASDELNNPLDSSLAEILDRVSVVDGKTAFLLPNPQDIEQVPQDPNNPITNEKVALGNLLFFESGVALASMRPIGQGTYSCGSCHVPAAGFLPGRIQGIADGGLGFGQNGEGRSQHSFYDESELDAQGARPLSQVNVAFATNTSWSGQFGAGGINEGTEALWNNNTITEVNHEGFTGVESQNMEGIHLHRMVYNKEVLGSLGYLEMFDAAFPNIALAERYSAKTASLAISAFTRTIIPYKAPFQEWLRGEKQAMTNSEKRGALLFFGKANCVTCHNGPALNALRFEAIGVNDLYQSGGLNTDANDRRNLGRGGFTELEEDMYKFRIPQLYNLKKAGAYFHGGSKSSLKEVVEYFNNGLPENENVPVTQISSYFHPLELTEKEIEDLTIFLSDALYDPDLERYVPKAVLSGNCIPNNDPFSRIDLGCN